MLDEAEVEVNLAMAYIRDRDALIKKLVELDRNGVQVNVMFQQDSLDLDLFAQLQNTRVDFRMLKYLHGKLLITDSTALQGSPNWTPTCMNRNFQFTKFETVPTTVFAYRRKFFHLFNMSKKYQRDNTNK